MDKGLCYGALGVAALMLVIFVLDLAIGIPFSGMGNSFGVFTLVDVFGILASGVVGYLAWNASRDLK